MLCCCLIVSTIAAGQVNPALRQKISPDLFGLFFKDINYAADGGPCRTGAKPFLNTALLITANGIPLFLGIHYARFFLRQPLQCRNQCAGKYKPPLCRAEYRTCWQRTIKYHGSGCQPLFCIYYHRPGVGLKIRLCQYGKKKEHGIIFPCLPNCFLQTPVEM